MKKNIKSIHRFLRQVLNKASGIHLYSAESGTQHSSFASGTQHSSFASGLLHPAACKSGTQHSSFASGLLHPVACKSGTAHPSKTSRLRLFLKKAGFCNPSANRKDKGSLLTSRGGLFLFWFVFLLPQLPACSNAQEDLYPELQQQILEAVQGHADLVLEHGRDRWSGQDTPLFADGLQMDDLEPAVWRHQGNEYFISNYASQQNLMRMLVALTRLTGESRYRAAAEETTRYMFTHHQYNSGLFPWGGHRFLDLKTLEDVYGFDANQHELKRHFPYYDLMFEVDSERAARLVRGIWESHIYDWSNNFFHNRHGTWVDEVPDNIWERPFSNPSAHQIIDRGTMVHTSNDLMYAAVHAYAHLPEQEKGALLWAHRKGGMWYKARNPDTHLGSYHYHLGHNPRSGWGTHIPGREDASFEWPAFEHYGMAATSTRLWATPGWPGVIYADVPIGQIRMAEVLGPEDGVRFMYWARTALQAFARSQAYNEETNTINRLLTDGRVIEQDYITAGLRFFYSFSLGYRATGDSSLWRVLRGVARAHDLGDVGVSPGASPMLNTNTSSAEPEALWSFLELYRALEHPSYLEMAIKIAQNILEQKYHEGFFVQSDRHLHVRFDDPEPLALLTLVATLQKQPEVMPLYPHGSAYIHGRFDGEGRTYDHRTIWSQIR